MFADKFPRLFLILDMVIMFSVAAGVLCWAAWSVGNLIGSIREWRYSLRGKVKRAFGVPAAA
jgi:hypothetical protein